MAATTTSRSCSGFWTGLRPGGPRAPRSGSCGPGKLDGVATWLMNGLASAFFASLERCSCVRVTTVEEDGDEYINEMPLIFNDGIGSSCSGSSSNNVRRRGGKLANKGQAYYEDDG